MTFVLTVGDPEEPVEVAVLENDEELLARICIGYDDETDATYSAFVALPRRSGGAPEEREIIFDVIEVTIEDGQEIVNWCNDGLQTRRFLVRDHRKVVLSCICTLVQILVEKAKPETVFMMTVRADLPKKALHKYAAICDAMKDIGYRGGRDSAFHGTEIWIMERTEDET